MDPHEIEDTSDWLDCPTPLDTCRHQLRMYENEFEELTLQLGRARENIQGLVQMNDELSACKNHMQAELNRLNSENSELSSTVRSLLLVSDQRDLLFRENQRLLKEKRERQ